MLICSWNFRQYDQGTVKMVSEPVGNSQSRIDAFGAVVQNFAGALL